MPMWDYYTYTQTHSKTQGQVMLEWNEIAFEKILLALREHTLTITHTHKDK